MSSRPRIFPVTILIKYILGRYRPDRIPVGPTTVRYIFNSALCLMSNRNWSDIYLSQSAFCLMSDRQARYTLNPVSILLNVGPTTVRYISNPVSIAEQWSAIYFTQSALRLISKQQRFDIDLTQSAFCSNLHRTVLGQRSDTDLTQSSLCLNLYRAGIDRTGFLLGL